MIHLTVINQESEMISSAVTDTFGLCNGLLFLILALAQVK